jgi:hypothetical protein
LRCWIRKVRSPTTGTVGFIPSSEHDEEDFEKLSFNVDLRADIVEPRNPGLHRKAFALLKIVWPHTNYPTIDRLRAAMTIGAGFVEDVINPRTGETVWVPKSWAFDAMGDEEFRELFNRLVDVALVIVPDSKREDWEAAVDQIVRF